MSRLAIVIANSVTSQLTKGLPVSKVRRAAEQVSEMLASLPGEHAFDVKRFVDQRPETVRNAIDRAASKCTSAKSLLLIYYFGHGRREADDLSFVHPGRGKTKREYLKFNQLFYAVKSRETSNVLFLLDCCYAGAGGGKVAQLPEKGHCLMACTTASTLAMFEERGDTPIGIFTRSVLAGLASPEATVTHAEDFITVESLFKFVREETMKLTKGTQEPYLFGSVTQHLSVYSPEPVIVSGTEDISPKSGYSKLLLTVRVLGRRTFPDLKTLYGAILDRDRRVFLTNFPDGFGGTTPRPAKWTVLRRYVGFLRAIQAVDEDDLRLTFRGLELISAPESDYNERLLVLLRRYLDRYGLTFDELKSTMRRVLQRRRLPTRANVLGDLTFLKQRAMTEQHLSMAMDLLGHIGVIGTLRRREQVYFPWADSSKASAKMDSDVF